MTLRKKIILSTATSVVLPIVMILGIWAGYVHWGSDAWIKPISRAADGGDLLTEAMNILYRYEAELSDMNWDIATFPEGEEADIVASPSKEDVEDLQRLGYDLQVADADGVSFSNLDEADQRVLERTAERSDGAIYWSGGSLVIRDSFRVSGKTFYLTAVYNEDRAAQSGKTSLLPMYMVSPVLLMIFLGIAVACITFVTILNGRWMRRSILLPLEELKKGADEIAGGNLDYRIPYAGQDEFGDVCSEFDHMRQQLRSAGSERQRYEEERRDLLRGISHDIRSPLTSIKGYAMGLRDGIADTEEKRQRYYDAILTRTEDLERLTGSLSLLVKLENDASILRPEKVCLSEYIGQLLSEKAAWLAEQRIQVAYTTEDEEIEVFFDISEMQRVFMNLFENTVRYRTGEQSQVLLSVLKRSDEVEIRFADDGPGVSSRHLRHLFESFYRADASRTEPGKGSGLGLAVVRRIIEGHGGRIYARSEGGLVIVMLLPDVKGGMDREEDPDHRG